MNPKTLIISCEHAVNTVPAEYQTFFLPFNHLLTTHRGIDFGAATIAQYLHQQVTNSYLVQATATRLLIDCNRSLHHAQCFSEVTCHVTNEIKQNIINRYYLPFRQEVINLIEQSIAQGNQVWHLSIHSFTPIMDNKIRQADIGLLYDPKRAQEKELAKKWQHELAQIQPPYRVRMNYPYKGTADGFTTTLRKHYGSERYLGIEVESNQRITQDASALIQLKKALAASLIRLTQL